MVIETLSVITNIIQLKKWAYKPVKDLFSNLDPYNTKLYNLYQKAFENATGIDINDFGIEGKIEALQHIEQYFEDANTFIEKALEIESVIVNEYNLSSSDFEQVKNNFKKELIASNNLSIVIDFIYHINNKITAILEKIPEHQSIQLSKDWFDSHIMNAIQNAKPRYRPEININTPIGEIFESFGCTENWKINIHHKIKSFKFEYKEYIENVLLTDVSGWNGLPLPESIENSKKEILEQLELLSISLENILLNITLDSFEKSIITINNSIALLEEIEEKLINQIDEKFGEGSSDSVGFRQWQAEYQSSFPASKLDETRKILNNLKELCSYFSSERTTIMFNKCLFINGEAGIGKTHAICDIAQSRISHNIYSIIFFGDQFNGENEIWEIIRSILGFSNNISKLELFTILNESSLASGYPLIIFIDGINETLPRNYWRRRIKEFMLYLESFNNIKLCISYRTSYKKTVLPNDVNNYTYTHTGFEDENVFFDACKIFFSFFGLKPPVFPILNPEFSNPLFLTLLCEVYKSERKEISDGIMGFNQLVETRLDIIDNEYKQLNNLAFTRKISNTVMEIFINYFIESNSNIIYIENAIDLIETNLNRNSESFLNFLIESEFLMLESDGKNEFVKFSFERVKDYFYANQIIKNYDGTNIIYLISNSPELWEQKGVLDSLSIILPEKFNVELTDLDNIDKIEAQKIVIKNLIWRAKENISNKTIDWELINSGFKMGVDELGLHLDGDLIEYFDSILPIAFFDSHLDAWSIHNVLKSKPLNIRDPFWCIYLYNRYYNKDSSMNLVKKIIDSAFNTDVNLISNIEVERWAVLLLWFCASPDRHIRDRSTKALVKITEKYSDVWIQLLINFIDINDEYIIERCLACAYGCLLRTRDKVVEKKITEIIYEKILLNSSAYQNAQIRDYSLSIYDLAVLDEVIETETNTDKIISSFISDVLAEIPNEQEREQLEEETKSYPKLFHSCIYDDFNVYTLNRIFNSYERFKPIGALILNNVLDLGYNRYHSIYDIHIHNKFGGGRARPTFAERLGKKYQWISYFRLASQLIDNKQEKSSIYEDDPYFKRGRDIDPSIVFNPNAISQNWWITDTVDKEKMYSEEKDDWLSHIDDLPDTKKMIENIFDQQKTHWLPLLMYPSWEIRNEDKNNSISKSTWLHIRSYLVDKDNFDNIWGWINKQDFMGGWLPEGMSFHKGFIGEYPWGYPFNNYDDGVSYKTHNVPYNLIPTANEYNPEFDIDCSQTSNFSSFLPNFDFFKKDSLEWNKLKGFKNRSGKLVFNDPSLSENDKSCLLVDTDYMVDFLEDNNYVLIWTVLGEKIIYDNAKYPRITFNRVHYLNPLTKEIVSTPYRWNRS